MDNRRKINKKLIKRIKNELKQNDDIWMDVVVVIIICINRKKNHNVRAGA